MDAKRSSVNPPAPQASAILSRWQRITDWSRSWLTLSASLIAGAVYLLFALHLIDDVKYVAGAFVVVVILLCEQLREERSERLSSFARVEAIQVISGQTTEALRGLSSRIDSVARSVAPRLYSFKECVDDLAKRLKHVDAQAPVVIEHLALDMAVAWDYVHRFLRDLGHAHTLQYRLLVLANDNATANTDREVARWCRAADESLERMKADLTEQAKVWVNGNCRVHFTIKRYSMLPVVHGIRMSVPRERNVCFVGFCRWSPAEYRRYDWGEPNFHRLPGHIQTPSLDDLANVFDGHFGHYWGSTTEPSFELSVIQEGFDASETL